MNLKPAILNILTLTLLVSVLCGCAGASIEPPGVIEAVPTPTSEPVPIPGGELSIPIPINPSSYSPLLCDTRELSSALSLVYESLIRYDQNNHFIPSLAESWKADAAGKVYTISLRRNVLWHDDKPFTAADVIATYSSLRLLGEESSYYYLIDRIDTLEATDSHTLRLVAKTAGLQALSALCVPIMPATEPLGNLPVGTGPYVVTRLDYNGIIMEANQNWWKVAPYISRIVCKARQDNEVALASFAAAQLNFVSTNSLSAGKYRQQGRTAVLDVSNQNDEVLLINYKKLPSFGDIKIRQAIAYALDRREIISKAYLNHANASDVPIPPDSWLYDTRFKVFDPSPEKAKQLLAESGWSDIDGDGILEKEMGGYTRQLRATLLVNDTSDSPMRKDVAALVKEQLGAVGFDIEIRTELYEPTAATPLLDYVTALETGDFELALAGFNLDRSGNLDELLLRNGSANYGGYESSTMESLLANATAAADEKTARDAYAALGQRFIDELPFINLYFRTTSIIYSEDIKGIKDIRAGDIFRTVEKWYFFDEATTP